MLREIACLCQACAFLLALYLDVAFLLSFRIIGKTLHKVTQIHPMPWWVRKVILGTG